MSAPNTCLTPRVLRSVLTSVFLFVDFSKLHDRIGRTGGTSHSLVKKRLCLGIETHKKLMSAPNTCLTPRVLRSVLTSVFLFVDFSKLHDRIGRTGGTSHSLVKKRLCLSLVVESRDLTLPL